MKILHRGDPCPCCGQPIKTKDPEILLLLSVIAAYVPSYLAVKDALNVIREKTDHAE